MLKYLIQAPFPYASYRCSGTHVSMDILLCVCCWYYKNDDFVLVLLPFMHWTIYINVCLHPRIFKAIQKTFILNWSSYYFWKQTNLDMIRVSCRKDNMILNWFLYYLCTAQYTRSFHAVQEILFLDWFWYYFCDTQENGALTSAVRGFRKRAIFR